MKQRNNKKKLPITKYIWTSNLPEFFAMFFPHQDGKDIQYIQNFTRCISTAKKDAVVCRSESINTELRLQQLEHMIEDKNHQEELRYTGWYLNILNWF